MTPDRSGKWDDLVTRLASGAILTALGVAGIWAGGAWFAGLSSIASGIMVWELARMTAFGPDMLAVPTGVVAGVAVFLAVLLPAFWAVLLLAACVAGFTILRRNDYWLFCGFAAAILVAGWSLATFRESYGVVWLFWLVFVVIATDVFGYFGGRQFGGAKFWPRVSPKKTWAGIVAGWVAAGVVGAAFLTFTNAGRDLIWISMLTAFASQMGDIAESALKRRSGVKDSSALIPGHGGLFDRFDGVLGASLFMMLTALIVDVPEVRF